jgi:hypothetical protein
MLNTMGIIIDSGYLEIKKGVAHGSTSDVTERFADNTVEMLQDKIPPPPGTRNS